MTREDTEISSGLDLLIVHQPINMFQLFPLHILPQLMITGFSPAWKVLEYTGLSWKFLEN